MIKRLLIIIDGMDDEPIPAFGGLTPSYFAEMPALRYMRKRGSILHQKTIPYGCVPGTEAAVLKILGYELPPMCSSRSWFEAIGAGIEVDTNDLCLRCNLITHEKGVITSHSGSNVTAAQCTEIVNVLNEKYGGDDIEFYGTGDYRCLLLLRGCEAKVEAAPPHTLIGRELSSLLVAGDETSLIETLNGIIENSRVILSKYPSNGISLWAPGRPMQFSQKKEGVVIAGVNVIKGIGRAIGMKVMDVDGATGDERTDYTAKLYAAMKALEESDFVLLHVEAPDEASHLKDSAKKVRILEEIDSKLLSPLLRENKDIDVTIQSDHATSSISGQHLDWPVEVIHYKLRTDPAFRQKQYGRLADCREKALTSHKFIKL